MAQPGPPFMPPMGAPPMAPGAFAPMGAPPMAAPPIEALRFPPPAPEPSPEQTRTLCCAESVLIPPTRTSVSLECIPHPAGKIAFV